MSYPVYGRYQIAEPPHNLLGLHLDDGTALKEVDWEPKVGVLDQSDLLAQGIKCSTFIAGAGDPDGLGSCTAQANTAALSNLLDIAHFAEYVQEPATDVYSNVIAAEKASIVFYHRCTWQTGDPSQEWPPTDCGSSGPYIVSEDQRLKLASGCKIAHGANNIVSLMQHGGLMVGAPFLWDWENPAADGMIDGDGKASTVMRQINNGVAGGHEWFLAAIEKLVVFTNGIVDPWHTICRARNSWSRSWGDNGSFRFHLSTLSHILAPYADFRLLVA